MNYNIIIYIIMLFASVFAVSGLNINSLFKKSKVNEARIFIILIIMGLAFVSSEFVIGIINLMKV